MITLSHVMKVNAASCIGFGFLFLFIPEAISHFLSVTEQAPNLAFTVLGIGLILNGIHLLWASLKSIPSKFLVLYFSFGDFLWVIGSIYLILTGLWITTSKGILAALVVAVFVGMCGILQMIKRKALGNC